MPTISFESFGGNTFDDGSIAVSLDEASLGPVTVQYRIIGQTALTGTSISASSGTLTIPAGSLGANLNINHFGASSGPDLNYTVEFTDVSGADFENGAQTVRVENTILRTERAFFVSDPIFIEDSVDGGVAVFEVRLSRDATSNLTFDYSTADGTAVAGEDYSAVSGTISFAPGETVQFIEVPITADGLAEFNESFSLNVFPQSGSAAAFSNLSGDASGVARILDDDQDSPLPAISIEFAEGNVFGDGQFVINLTEAALGDVTVQFQVSGQTALTGTGISTNSGTVTIPAGETSIFLNVDHFGSGSVDQVYTVELTDPSGAVLEGDQQLLRTTGVILHGDRALTVSDPIIDEETGEAVFEVRLTRPSDAVLTFDVTTADGTAVAGDDYTAVTQTLTFAPGQTLAAVRVPILDDGTAELSETFSLVVTPQTPSAPAISDFASDGAGIATIHDGDTAGPLPILTIEPAEGNIFGDGQFTVRLSEPTLGDVTVTALIIGQTALTGSDISSNFFTVRIPAGETARNIDIDHFSSGTEDDIYTIELTDPNGAVFPQDAELIRETGVILRGELGLSVSDPVIFETDGQQEAVFEVRLTQPSNQPLVIDFETRDGSALAGEDYTPTSGTLTFLPGQTVASVRVPILGDTIAEGSEFFTLGLTPQAGSVAAIRNGFDDAEGVGIIHDNDASDDLPTVSIEFAEGNIFGDGQFILRLDEPSLGPVTVQYRVIGETAQTGADISFASGNITIRAGETSTVLNVDHFSSGMVDDNFTIELTDPSGAVLAGDAEVVRTTGVILRGERALFVDDPVVYETDDGAFAVFEIRLSRPSDTALNFDFSTVDGSALAGSDYEAVSGSITFDPGQTVASVRVPILGDRIGEGAEVFSLVVTPDVVSAAAISSGAADGAGIATILDDDTDDDLPILTIEFAEGNDFGNGQFAVRLSEPSASNITFTINTLSDTAFAGTDISNFSGTQVTIPAGEQTIFLSVDHFNRTSGNVDAGYFIEVSNVSGAVIAGGANTVTARGIALEGGLGLFVGDGVAAEGDSLGENTVAFEIRLSRPSDAALTFDYATSDGTGLAGGDYTETIGSITFEPGQTVAFVHVPIIGDTVEEASVDFNLTVTPTVGTAAAILNGSASASGVGTIVDDDVPTEFGSSGADNIVGGTENDVVMARSGDDTINGGVGNDTLSGNAGDDLISGGIGQDVLLGGSGADTINGGGGDDTISFADATGPVRVFLNRGEGLGGAANGDQYISVENIVGSNFDDRLFGDDLANFISGGVGNDVILGFDGSDDVFGDAGNDDLRGGFGDDTLDGGGNNDTVIGGNGEDEIFGGNGEDLLLGNNDDDFIFGGSSADNVNGGGGEDEVYGDAGNDIVSGGARNDRVFGGTGNDTVNGGLGNDVAIGGSGDDDLRGGIGQDFLRGGAGDDTIGGGTGGDRFVFGEDDFGNDVIRDFTNADVIDLSRLDVTVDDLTITSVGSSTLITLDQGTIRLNGVDAATVNANDFDFMA